MKTLYEYFLETKDYLTRKASNHLGEFPLGVPEIDGITGGIDRGQIMVIGGSSGSGKSSLAMQMAFNLSRQGKDVLVFSLEMTGKELVGRLFCMEESIDNALLRTGASLDPAYPEKEKRFKNKIRTNPLHIVEDKGYRFDEIVEVIKGGYEHKKPDIIFLDHLHLIEWAGNQNEAIVTYIRKLAELVKTHQIALVLISQLRRPPAGSNYDKIPSRFDLLGSGSIDQIAHLILIIYRQIEMGDLRCFINIDKNRMGETRDDVCVDFKGKYFRFDENFKGGQDDRY